MTVVRYLSFAIEDLPIIVELDGIERLRLSRSPEWGNEIVLAYEMLAAGSDYDAVAPWGVEVVDESDGRAHELLSMSDTTRGGHAAGALRFAAPLGQTIRRCRLRLEWERLDGRSTQP